MAAILECQNAKNRKSLMKGPFWHKINPTPLRFSNFHIFLFLVTEANMNGLQLDIFETSQCKNHFDTNFVKIHSAVTEILSFSCFVLFLVTADGGHLGCQIAINQNDFMQGTFWHKIGPIPFKGSWVIVIFMFVLFLVTPDGGHLGMPNCN